jgi:hypothetical protein
MQENSLADHARLATELAEADAQWIVQINVIFAEEGKETTKWNHDLFTECVSNEDNEGGQRRRPEKEGQT